ncbi:MAG: hypothetical protein OEW36_12300 [Hylemonella sp.]|nr:hypothetical protein [Hylemonella sp.]
MESTNILLKTARGQSEIKDRAAGLPQAVRGVLIMIDGATTVSGFRKKTASLPHAMEHLSWLIEHGFVEATDGGDPVSGFSPSVLAAHMGPHSSQKSALIELSRKLLGDQADKVVKRLEETPDTPDQLLAALDRCHKLIKLTIDEGKASRFLVTGQEIMSHPPQGS